MRGVDPTLSSLFELVGLHLMVLLVIGPRIHSESV